jgi:tetratricopeptide (TPR) repeat protein
VPKRRPSSPHACALTYLRTAAGLSMTELAHLVGHADKSLISKHERNEKPLSREQLESLVAPLGYSPEAVDVFLFAHGLIHSEPPEGDSSLVGLLPEELRTVDRAAMAAGWTAGRIAAEAVRAERVRTFKEQKRALEIRGAEELFQALYVLAQKERLGLVEAFPVLWNWALAVRCCEASLKSAGHKAEEALELAELAVAIAERVKEDETWRSRLLGYCWAHVANARRVANDLAGAEETFARSWLLWGKGVDPIPAELGEWRLLSLEASLRRAQRRFSEALELIQRARVCQGEANSPARLNLIMKEVSILSRMGEPELALRALAEAAPLCEASGDRQMNFALRFNMADNLCQLERFEEAAELLPQIRELALQQGNELDLIRVGWLDARVAAGEGRTADAIAGLEQVSREFSVRGLAYNAALSSLDLAVLFLATRRTVEVRKLAVAMAWIFRSKGIDREALVALKFFCNAARQERATVELAQQAMVEIQQTRRSASPLN